MPAVRVLAIAVLCLALGSLAVALGRDGIGLGQNGEWVLIRLPRVLGALAAGWALGIAGCAQQGLFRNPLADPGLTGVFGGALLGVTLLLCAAPDLAWDNRWALPIAAASGALAAMSALLALGRGRSVAGLLLAGLGINALAGAATLLAMTWAEGERGSIVTAQLGGWLGMLTPELAALPSLIGIVAGLLLLTQARGLDRLALGEAAARHSGTDPAAAARQIAGLTAVAAGAATCLCGQVAFVGLLAPHLARGLVGPAHRWAMPTAGLCGALLVLTADTLGRTALPERNLPASALIALIGAPAFIWLARRHHG